MDAQAAERLALRLMDEHGLVTRGWRFVWSRSKRQFGLTQITTRHDPVTRRRIEEKIIKLSAPLTALNDEHQVRDTILHEIAHALAGLDHGHDAVWAQVCRRIGANPQRLIDDTVVMPPSRYHLICGQCRRVLEQRDRVMPRKHLKRAYCRYCGPSTVGKITLHAAAAT